MENDASVEEQKIEEQKVEVQLNEEQKVEVQLNEEQKVEVQLNEEQKIEVQLNEEQKVEVQVNAEQKNELEEQKIEVQLNEELKIEEQKIEGQTNEEQKIEGQKNEEQKTEEQKNGDVVNVDQVKEPAAEAIANYYRYTKEELLEIKDLPCSNERPECLAEKYDSDGVWDPEKWHASLYPTSGRSSPVDGFKKDYDDRVPLKRRIPDPRERLKDDDMDVVLSPQRRSFGGGCQVSAPPSRRPISPLENKENESLRLGGARRIGSGRIIATRAFERETRVEKERERERDFKDKRFRRDFGDKRVFSERRRNDSYAEEEPEWFSGGPTSQSETIELIGFDDKILDEDRRRSKRSRKRTESLKEAVECNGGLAEEPDVCRAPADQEVPHPVLPEQSAGEFDFNEFFNLEKTMPGLASMIEDVLGDGPVSASRFSQWFSSNLSPSGSRSSSLRSTPHEELERLAGLEPRSTSPSQGPVTYFTPIQSSEHKEKVDILEILHKAKVDLKPLLSSLSVNKARLRESTNSGVVLSLEEVEGGMNRMRLGTEPHVHKVSPPQRGDGTPFMVEHLEEALTGGSCVRPRSHDPDMSAFNKLVFSMKASGTLPPHPKANSNNQSDAALVPRPDSQVPAQQQKNIFQELLGGHGPPRSSSPNLLGSLLSSSDAAVTSTPLHHGLLHKGPSPPLFPQRAPSPDYFHRRLQPSGYPVGSQPMMAEQFTDMHRSISPGPTPQQMRALSMAASQADLETLAFQQDLALHAHHHSFQTGYNKQPQDKAFRNSSSLRQPRMNSPHPHPAGRNSPGNVTSMLSPSFTPTSVIRKMYETKEKSRDEPGSRQESKDEAEHSHDDNSSPHSYLDSMNGSGSHSGGVKVSSQNFVSKDHERLRPGSGQHTPTMVNHQGPASSFPRPIYPVPLLSHVPMVRAPPPPQIHPSMVQRMLAQGMQPQQLGPALLQAGIFPPHVDLAQLQGLHPAVLGQPLYPLGPTGHPLLPPRTNAQMQLAVMQQQLQQQRPMHPHQSQSHGPHRTNSQRHGGSPPLGLSKWFGSDVLEQPLPSMPAKVISVDELEFRP